MHPVFLARRVMEIVVEIELFGSSVGLGSGSHVSVLEANTRRFAFGFGGIQRVGVRRFLRDKRAHHAPAIERTKFHVGDAEFAFPELFDRMKSCVGCSEREQRTEPQNAQAFLGCLHHLRRGERFELRSPSLLGRVA